jgi:tRNA(Ile)-lysidine synthase
VGPPAPVAAVRAAVRAALADVPGDGPVLVAASGGPDSAALAEAAAFVAPRLGLAAGALTVDHGLQDGSAGRARGLAAALGALGLDPVEVLPVRVGTAGGPEAAARAARYLALAEAAGRLGGTTVLLGHTRDDQAETVLLGLARGSGARSLAGMPGRAGLYRRPLLDLSRATVRAAARAVPVWDDPHNRDPAFLRSRVRHEVLPVLEDVLGPGVAAALARTAGLLADDADALDSWAAEAAPDLGVDELAALPRAVRTRVLRRAAVAAGCPGGHLTAGHVHELDRLVTDWHGQGPLHLPGGVRGERRCGRLLLVSPPTPTGA